jgi:hypothetical protein
MAFLGAPSISRALTKSGLAIRPKPPYIIHTFYFVYAAIVLFYIGFVPQLIDWLYATSFGNLVIMEGTPPSIPFRLASYAEIAALMPLAGAILVSSGAYIFCAVSRQKVIASRLLYLATVPPLIAALVLLTPEWYPRKIPIAVTALYIILVAIALLPGRWRGARAAVIGLIAFAQMIGTAAISHGLNLPRGIQVAIGAQGFPNMVTQWPNQTKVAAAFLDRAAVKYHLKFIRTPASSACCEVEAFVLGLLITESDKTGLGFILHNKENNIPESIHEFTKEADAIFLINESPQKFIHTEEEIVRLTNRKNSLSKIDDKIYYELLIMESGNRIAELGFEKIDCLILASGREACLYTRSANDKSSGEFRRSTILSAKGWRESNYYGQLYFEMTGETLLGVAEGPPPIESLLRFQLT